MKKIININLSSRLIPIEDSAYDLLKNYLESLRRYFGREEGGDEIVADIENRIAEVFQDKLKKGAHCITDEDVSGMVNTMGRPDQLEEETATEPQQKQTYSGAMPPPPGGFDSKRLLRDENDKILGGVCSGIAAYFKIDPVIIRILTFLLIWAWGVGVLVYIILWIVLPSSRTLQNPVRKRLYRNPDNKVISGVCSGIAAYLNIDAVIPRIVFALPLLGIIFSSIFHHWMWFPGFFFPLSVGSLPTLIVLYIILWISVPKAMTVTEKLEMRGERVDLQNITDALKGSQDEKKNEFVSPVTPQDTDAPDSVSHTTANPEAGPIQPPLHYPPYPTRRHSTLGYLVVSLLKILAFCVLAFICVIICIALVSVAGGFIGAATFSSMMLPFKGLVLQSSLQHFLAWPAILLTLGIPVAGIIWLLIKLVTGFRPRTKYVGLTLFILWMVGLVCAVWLCASVARDFRMNFRETTQLPIQQPSHGKLILARTANNISIGGWNMLENVIEIGEDTLILKTIRLDIEKSPDDSFRMELAKASNGYSVTQARNYARALDFNYTQQDSTLYIPDGFSIPKGMPFRNQRMILRIYVPEGKSIHVDYNLNHLKHHWNWDIQDWDDDHWSDSDNHTDWQNNEDYLMTPEGLKSTDDLNEEKIEENKPREEERSEPDSTGKSYRYHPSKEADSVGKNVHTQGGRRTLTLFS